MKCPCTSDQPYTDCCELYHTGELPENALKLMRSRYSAYALGLADYIISTTHPTNATFSLNFDTWKKQILEFSHKTRFDKLTILEFIDGQERAYVTFKAHLTQNNQDASFTEKSVFIKENNKWFYQAAESFQK